MYLVVVSIILLFASRGFAANLTEVQALHTAMFTGYNKKILPVFNQDRTVNVSFDMYPVSINEFDELSGQVTATVSFYVSWIEERISWKPNHYGNQTSIIVPSEDLWTPQIFTVNAADKIEALGNLSLLTRVLANGLVIWNPGHVIKFICAVDVTFFPFDEQVCSLTVVSWSYTAKEVWIFAPNPFVTTDYYTNNSQWELAGTAAYSERKVNTSFVTFVLKLKRRTLFSLVYVILPVLFLSFLNNLVFLMPATSGERTSVAMTCFLSFVVFMTIVNDNVPQSSSPISYMNYYLLYLLFHSSLIFFMNVMSLRVYDKAEPVNKHVSDIVKMARCVCLWRKGELVTPSPEDWDDTKTAAERTPSKKSLPRGQVIITWKVVGKTFDAYCFTVLTLVYALVSIIILYGLYTHASFIPTTAGL